MEMYQILMVVFSGLTLLGSGAAVMATIIIKFNDISHLSKNIEKVDKNIEEIKKDIVEIKLNCASKCK